MVVHTKAAERRQRVIWLSHLRGRLRWRQHRCCKCEPKPRNREYKPFGSSAAIAHGSVPPLVASSLTQTGLFKFSVSVYVIFAVSRNRSSFHLQTMYACTEVSRGTVVAALGRNLPFPWGERGLSRPGAALQNMHQAYFPRERLRFAIVLGDVGRKFWSRGGKIFQVVEPKEIVWWG